jgi:hypothetical protein
MNVSILGLWHLGAVSAGCIVGLGHRMRSDLAVGGAHLRYLRLLCQPG